MNRAWVRVPKRSHSPNTFKEVNNSRVRRVVLSLVPAGRNDEEVQRGKLDFDQQTETGSITVMSVRVILSCWVDVPSLCEAGRSIGEIIYVFSLSKTSKYSKYKI